MSDGFERPRLSSWRYRNNRTGEVLTVVETRVNEYGEQMALVRRESGAKHSQSARWILRNCAPVERDAEQ